MYKRQKPSVKLCIFSKLMEYFRYEGTSRIFSHFLFLFCPKCTTIRQKKRKKQNKERQERIANFCLANFFPFNSYDETIVNEAVVKTKFIRRELLLYSLYIYEVYVYAFPFAKYYLFTCYGYTSLSELFLFRRR